MADSGTVKMMRRGAWAVIQNSASPFFDLLRLVHRTTAYYAVEWRRDAGLAQLDIRGTQVCLGG